MEGIKTKNFIKGTSEFNDLCDNARKKVPHKLFS